MKIKCPICNNELKKIDGSYKCSSNHCFDISRGGYVNLLTGSKSSDQTGDNPIMSRARHDFLSKGYKLCNGRYKLANTWYKLCNLCYKVCNKNYLI